MAKPLFSNYINWLGKQNESQSLDFWKQKLHGYSNVAELKVSENASEINDEFYTQDFVFNLTEELTLQLDKVSRKFKTTISTIMQAAYGLILSCYTKSDDVVFGVIVSGRPTQIPDIQNIVGLLFNTIPLRVRTKGTIKLSDLLNDIQKYFIESQEHHYLNVADFNKMGLSVRNPIRTLLTFENYPTEEMNPDYYTTADDDKFIFEQTNYDLSTIIIPGNELQFIVKYNPVRYSINQIEELKILYESILSLIAQDEDVILTDIKNRLENKITEKNKVESEQVKDSNLSKLKKFIK
jgi:hypothetical protein